MDDPLPTRPALVPAIAFTTGACLGAALHLPWWAWAGAAAAALGVAALSRGRVRRAHAGLWLAAACFGSFWFAQHQLLPACHIAHATASSPSVMVHGVVVSDPVEVMTPYREDRATFVMEARDLGSSIGWRRTSGLVRVTMTGVDLPVAYGDELLLAGRLSAPAPPWRPGDFDYAAYLGRRGIHAQLRVRPSEGWVRLRSHRGRPWVEAALHLKHAWRRSIDGAVPRQTQGLLAALVLGDRLALDKSLEQAFIATGTVHLLAISGFNVALLAWTLNLVFGWLWVPRQLRYAVTAAALGLYAIMTGFQPPVVRSTVMAWLWLGAQVLERDVDLWQILGLSAILLVVMNPVQIGDVGFQLSFISVAAIAYLVPRWQQRLPASGVGRYAGQGMLVSAAAWLGVAPLVWYHFHLVTPLTILVNLIAVPLTEAILVAGLALGMVGWVWKEIALVLGGWCHLGLSALQRFVMACAAVPGSVVRLQQPAVWVVLAWYAALVITVERRRLRLAEVHLAMAGLVLLNLLLWWRAVWL